MNWFRLTGMFLIASCWAANSSAALSLIKLDQAELFSFSNPNDFLDAKYHRTDMYVQAAGRPGNTSVLGRSFTGGPASNVAPGLQFSISTSIPGARVLAGLSTGNHTLPALNPLWTLDTNFVFSGGVTTVLAHIDSCISDDCHNANLTFLPIGGAVPAVPEPQTYAMMLAGLGILGFVARRRRKLSLI